MQEDFGERLARVETIVDRMEDKIDKLDGKLSNGLCTDIALLKETSRKSEAMKRVIWGAVIALMVAQLWTMFFETKLREGNAKWKNEKSNTESKN